MQFLDDIKKRRSVYNLGKNIEMQESQISDIIAQCAKHTPAAFNMPTTHIIIAFGGRHRQIWQSAKDILHIKMKNKPEAFEATSAKIDGFLNGIGTVLYYEDEDIINDLKETYAMYAENFSIWSSQANGMLQCNIWTALASCGIGANIQHYNPLIDDKMKELFAVPDTWKLTAQMPFGSIEKAPKEPYFEPVEKRVHIYFK